MISIFLLFNSKLNSRIFAGKSFHCNFRNYLFSTLGFFTSHKNRHTVGRISSMIISSSYRWSVHKERPNHTPGGVCFLYFSSAWTELNTLIAIHSFFQFTIYVFIYFVGREERERETPETRPIDATVLPYLKTLDWMWASTSSERQFSISNFEHRRSSKFRTMYNDQNCMEIYGSYCSILYIYWKVPNLLIKIKILRL